MAFSSETGIFTLQEFKGREVIKLAPDVLVYFSGQYGTQVVSSVAGGTQSTEFSSGITNLSISNVVDPSGGSQASIEIVTPIYSSPNSYWDTVPGINGTDKKIPIFVPMMEVKIYLKGRFMVNGSPQYYPAFWGFISELGETYNGGVYKISLQCCDMLHWWAYSIINTHPTVGDNVAMGGNLKQTIYKTIFEQSNPFGIIHALNNFAGMESFVAPSWTAQSTPLSNIYPAKARESVMKGVMAYWKIRLKQQGSLLKMYGVGGRTVDRNGKYYEPDPHAKNVANTIDSGDIDQSGSKPDNLGGWNVQQELQDFTALHTFENMGNFEQSEYQNKLEIAINIKNRIQFEFFQDTNGNFVFKPPFFNLDVKGVQPYTINPSDIMSSSFQSNTESICTVMQVTTQFAIQLQQSPSAKGIGFHQDIDLMKQYGVRFQEKTVQFTKDKEIARSLAAGEMALINAKAKTGSLTIPGRPEMRLGYPVYLPHRDSYHYVKSISHSFDFAGSFNTTLSLETERVKIFDADGVTPLKNHAYVYDKAVRNTDTVQETIQKLRTSTGQIAQTKHGLYKVEENRSLSLTHSTFPYTDEDGYKVVGGFQYGRGLSPVVIDMEEPTGTSAEYKLSLVTTMQPQNAEGESKAMEDLKKEAGGKEGLVPTPLVNFSITSGASNTIGSDGTNTGVIKNNLGDKGSVNDPTTAQKNQADNESAALAIQYGPMTEAQSKALVNQNFVTINQA